MIEIIQHFLLQNATILHTSIFGTLGSRGFFVHTRTHLHIRAHAYTNSFTCTDCISVSPALSSGFKLVYIAASFVWSIDLTALFSVRDRNSSASNICSSELTTTAAVWANTRSEVQMSIAVLLRFWCINMKSNIYGTRHIEKNYIAIIIVSIYRPWPIGSRHRAAQPSSLC